jgi:hypothetical protein
MWKLKVPKLLHCFWGGELLPYLRFMTIKSFRELNPDWAIVFWYPKYVSGKITWRSGELDYKLKCRNFLQDLMDLPIVKMEIDFQKLGFPVGTAEVHKADYMRMNALALYGGVWTDMDIVYFKPIAELEVNVEKHKNAGTFVCKADYGHSTGFLMASENNEFFGKLSDLIAKEFRASQYQCIGPALMNKYYSSLMNAVNLKMDVVYAHDCNHVTELIENRKPRFTEGSIGCHWYGGHKQWGNYLNETNGGLIKKDNIISNCYA